MLDASGTHIIEVSDAEALCKPAGGVTELGGLDILAGSVVVQHDGDLFRVKNLCQAGTVKGGYRHGGGDVVSQDQIQLGFDQVARLDRGQARVSRQDLLRHCHSHDY